MFSLDELKDKTNINAGINKSVTYFKTHWIDYLLLFFICLILGAFDVFILKRSDNLFSASYWYHSACRVTAYILASILGVRIGYPKYKEANKELSTALEKNQKLLSIKEENGTAFSEFIVEINKEIKTNAWKSYIQRKLKKLDKKSPDSFPLYYVNKDKTIDKFLEQYKRPHTKKLLVFLEGLRLEKLKKRLLKYCNSREILEKLLDEDYIKNNIHVLNIKYIRVKETDFLNIETNDAGYFYYKTTKNVKTNAARKISSTILITLLFVVVLGSISITIDEALVEARVVTIFSIIINSIIDIGFTLWKFIGAFLNSEKIVKQEDLRAVTDQNTLLLRFIKTLQK